MRESFAQYWGTHLISLLINEIKNSFCGERYKHAVGERQRASASQYRSADHKSRAKAAHAYKWLRVLLH